MDIQNEPYNAEATLENLSITEGLPLGLLAHSSLRGSRPSSVVGLQPPQTSPDVETLGIASPNYFKPSKHVYSVLSCPYLTRYRSFRQSISIAWSTEDPNRHDRA